MTDVLQVVPARLKQAVRNKLQQACCHQLVNNGFQTISHFLERLDASVLASTTLLQDNNNYFKNREQTARTHLVDKP